MNVYYPYFELYIVMNAYATTFMPLQEIITHTCAIESEWNVTKKKTKV